MPISGPTSYVPTLNQFIPHWTSVNLVLGAGGPLVLEDGTTLAILTGYRNQLDGFRTSIPGKANDVQIASATIKLKRAVLVSRLGEFNRKVRARMGSSPYAAALPQVPSVTSGEGLILEPLNDMATLWPKINAATIPGFTGPLLLPGGYAIATYLTDLAALRAAYVTEQTAQNEINLELKLRNFVQDKAYDAMRDYREAVAGEFTDNDPHVLSLPDLTPAAGSTPDAVTASVAWMPLLLKAKITFSASTNLSVIQYEIRFCPGANYSTDTESVIGSISPGATLEFLTNAGLAVTGDTASFKVYVITSTGNEKGSNTLVITRPEVIPPPSPPPPPPLPPIPSPPPPPPGTP